MSLAVPAYNLKYLIKAQTGENKIWLINGTSITTQATLTTLGTSWVSSIGDFNGDRLTDIFWHNAQTGENQIWLMDGQNITSKTTLTTINTAWTPSAGVCDFNGDGNTDIFWRNSQTGENAIWLMNGTNVTAATLPSLPIQWGAHTS